MVKQIHRVTLALARERLDDRFALHGWRPAPRSPLLEPAFLHDAQHGAAGDDQLVFGADASDRITAWKTASGDVAWQTEKLLYRGLGAPLSTPKAVIFGDSEGMVHFLSRDKGETLQRLPTDGSPIAARIFRVVSGGWIAETTAGRRAVRVDPAIMLRHE